MKSATTKRTSWRVRLTKVLAWTAFSIFLIASALTSNYMPWSWFYGTWGVTLVLAGATVLGFCDCRTHEEPIGAFYLICPALLAAGFFVVLNTWNMVDAILRLEGYSR